jgi:hypothetical protein
MVFLLRNWDSVIKETAFAVGSLIMRILKYGIVPAYQIAHYEIVYDMQPTGGARHGLTFYKPNRPTPLVTKKYAWHEHLI